MVYVFKSGKLKGMSLEQLAVTDYPKFRWLRKNATRLPQEWLDRMDGIIYALDNFESKKKCVKCREKPAAYLSIIEQYYPTKDVAASLGYIYCSPICFENDSGADHQEAILYEAKYSKIFSHFKRPFWPKVIVDDLHKLMYKLLAGDMRKTKEDLHELINSILLNRDRIIETP